MVKLCRECFERIYDDSDGGSSPRDPGRVKLDARLAWAASAAAGLLVLAPVVIVIALGAYGSSIGGQPIDANDTGAVMSIQPASGRADSQVTVKGQRWPPRSEIDLYLSRGNEAESTPFVRIANGVTSRKGGFSFSLALPAALSGPQTAYFLLRAEVVTRSGTVESFATTDYRIEPYPNELTVHVIDSRSASSIEGAHVELSSSFGGSPLKLVTGTSGVARFSNLRPGVWSASVRRLNYRRASTTIELNSTGRAVLSIPIAAQRQRRLYLPVFHFYAGPAATVAGIDWASGLRSDATVRTGDWDPKIPVEPSSRTVVFSVPLDIGGADRADGQGGSRQLQTILYLLRQAALGNTGSSDTFSPALIYIGRSAEGETLVMVKRRDAAGSFRFQAVDSRTGNVRVLQEHVSVNDASPVLSDDGLRYFLIDRSTRELLSIDLGSGKTVGRASGTPSQVTKVAPGRSGDEVFVLAQSGEVFRADFETGNTEGPLADVPGATSLSVSSDGRRLFLVGPGLNSLVVLDLDARGSFRLVPAQTPATWVWADPEGPYVYVGSNNFEELILIDGDSLELAGRITFAGEVDG